MVVLGPSSVHGCGIYFQFLLGNVINWTNLTIKLPHRKVRPIFLMLYIPQLSKTSGGLFNPDGTDPKNFRFWLSP